MINKCIDCEDRYIKHYLVKDKIVTCHSECESYLEYHRQQEELRLKKQDDAMKRRDIELSKIRMKNSRKRKRR